MPDSYDLRAALEFGKPSFLADPAQATAAQTATARLKSRMALANAAGGIRPPLRKGAIPGPVSPAASPGTVPPALRQVPYLPGDDAWAGQYVQPGHMPFDTLQDLIKNQPADWPGILKGYDPKGVGYRVLTNLAKAYQSQKPTAYIPERAAELDITPKDIKERGIAPAVARQGDLEYIPYSTWNLAGPVVHNKKTEHADIRILRPIVRHGGRTSRAPQ
jgi:hypothetical protein